MTYIDYLIFGVYMAGVMAVGVYHFFKNKSSEDYYVGSRSIKASHVGLSIVATDVGGGFSIGLGGVGFLMGLAGSWLLFTGLLGAWLTAVFVIPRIKKLDAEHKFMTYPDFLRHRYNGSVALVAALVSGIGYLGFTGAQMLAGAKLASATILPTNPFNMDPVKFALLVIAAVTILYTVIGGLKAVIYTDTIQWIVLLTGLIFVTIPATLYKIGGVAALRDALPAEYFSLGNITAIRFVNWMVTIIPIWLVGMTLYQRMYACKDEKQAKKAWYIAGVFEYPIMAFTGVFLGMCARVVFPEAEPEMALPMLIRDILPLGITGIVIASYFSAIMSTADSCLMASSGNFVNDVIERYFIKNISDKQSIRLSMIATLIVGILAVVLAAQFSMVLDAILYAYAFLVSGLFVPTFGAFFWKRATSKGALVSMIGGGSLTLYLMILRVVSGKEPLDKDVQFDYSIYGIGFSALLFVIVSLLTQEKSGSGNLKPETTQEDEYDTIEKVKGSLIHHGPANDRLYLMKLGDNSPEEILPVLENIVVENEYSKMFVKVPAVHSQIFKEWDFRNEAMIPGFYDGQEAAVFMGKYYDPDRKIEKDGSKYAEVEQIMVAKLEEQKPLNDLDGTIRECSENDVEKMAEIYKEVFASYPFPIHKPEYLLETMESHVVYYCVEKDGEILALSSAEMDETSGNVEMTDFATPPSVRGRRYAEHLLQKMEQAMQSRGLKTAYTIARAISPGMNITFARAGYNYGGRLVNNTYISGGIESMNVWYKPLE